MVMKVFNLGSIPYEGDEIYDRRGRKRTRMGYGGDIYDHYGHNEHDRRMRELEEREDELEHRERKLEERERRHEYEDEMYRRRAEEMKREGWMGERLYPRDEEEYGPYARRGGGRRGGGRRGSY